MKKTLRTFIIVMIAIMTLSIATVSASAASLNITSFKLSKTSVTISEGKSVSLGISYGYKGTKPTSKDLKNITWKSSNSNVAIVKGGVIKGNKAGTAKITATFGGKTATCTVKVTAINVNAAYTELNKYRKNAKLATLKKDANLEKIAKIRAKEMATTGKFSHTRPNGKSGLTLITGNKHKGENIAKGQTTAAEVTKAWYNSKGHRDNMLRKQFTKVGIACYTHNGVTYWAQVFSSN